MALLYALCVAYCRYAYFKKLDYFSTECIYSPNAYRGNARAFIKDLERVRPTAIIDIIYSGETMSVKKEVKMPVQGTCSRCGYVSSQTLCKACLLLEGLNRGLPRLGIGKSDKIRRQNGLLRLDEAVVSSVTESTNSQVSTSAATAAVSSQSTAAVDSSAAVCSVTSTVNRQLCHDLSNCSCEATT